VIPAIDPGFLTTGSEWQVAPAAPPAAPQTSFAGMLGEQLGKLTDLQTEAADQSRQLATGQATDPTTVVMAVERARLAMQVASQLRTKGVEAVNDVLHTQV